MKVFFFEDFSYRNHSFAQNPSHRWKTLFKEWLTFKWPDSWGLRVSGEIWSLTGKFFFSGRQNSSATDRATETRVFNGLRGKVQKVSIMVVRTRSQPVFTERTSKQQPQKSSPTRQNRWYCEIFGFKITWFKNPFIYFKFYLDMVFFTKHQFFICINDVFVYVTLCISISWYNVIDTAIWF